MECTELKAIIRGILISNPKSMTVKELSIDFRKTEGMEIPFQKYGYNSLLEFLKSLPDTVKLDSSNRYNPVVTPVKNEKTSHIDSLVTRQKVTSKVKRSYQFGPPSVRRREAVTAPRNLMDTNSSKPLPVINTKRIVTEPSASLLDERLITFKTDKVAEASNKNDYEDSSHVIVPWNIINLLHHLCRHPEGISFAEAERHLRNDFDKAGIKGILDTIPDLKNYFDIYLGKIYQLGAIDNYCKPSVLSKPSPNSQNHIPVASCGMTSTQVAEAAVRATNDSGVEKKKQSPSQWAPPPDIIYIPAGAESSMLNRRFSDFSDCGSNASDSSRRTMVNIGQARVDSDEFDDEDDGVESMISSKMKANLRKIIKKYPDGIYCSQLPALYLKEFNSTLNYDDYGYDCVINMVSDLKSVFTLKRENRNSDWKLFSANVVKNETYVEDTVKKWVSREIIQNIIDVLENSTKGLALTMFCDKYLEYHKKPLNVDSLGFDSLQMLVDNLSDYIHQRKVGDKILLYVIPEKQSNHDSALKPPYENLLSSNFYPSDDALPDFDKLKTILSSLYPEEVCGPEDTYRKQKIPEITDTKSRFFEIRVSEVTNPHKFWIQLGSEYKKLDKMMVDLDEFYSNEEYHYKMPDMTIKPGQVCVCPYDIEEKWHRTVVVNSCNAVEVKIEYVDYGTVCRVPKSKLRFLHRDFFELPGQAIKAKLAAILPPDGYEKWPPGTGRKLLEMVSDRRLFMEACVIDHEECVIEGVIYDTNGSEDIVINDYLANYGFAKFISFVEDKESSESNEDNDDKVLSVEFQQNLSHKSPEKERSSLSPKSHFTEESSQLNTAGSIVPDIINNKFPDIQKSLPDIPYGQKDPVTTPVVSVQSSFTADADSNGLSRTRRPPPGFTSLSGSSATILSVTSQESILPKNTTSFVGSSAVPSVHVKQNSFPELDAILAKVLASNAAASTSSMPNYLVNMYHGYPPPLPPVNANSFSSFQDVNATSWNTFPSAAAMPNSSVWYNMAPPSHATIPSFGQVNQPQPPIFFPPIFSTPCVPPTEPTMVYHQNHNNYNLPPSYLPLQISQQPVYPWPNSINNASALPSRPPTNIGSIPEQQIPGCTVKKNEHHQISPMKSCNQTVIETAENTNTDIEEKLKPSESKVGLIVSDKSKTNSTTDELSNKERTKSESSWASSWASLLFSNSSDAGSNKFCDSKINNGASAVIEDDNSLQRKDDGVKESSLNSKSTSKKKKNKSNVDADHVNDEVEVSQSPGTLVCSSLNGSNTNNLSNNSANNNCKVSISATTLSVPSVTTSRSSLPSVIPVSLRRPKLLPSCSVHLLLANTDTVENSNSEQASKCIEESTKQITASQTTVEEPPTSNVNVDLASLACSSNSNNNNKNSKSDECVVDSWEELADVSNNVIKDEEITNDSRDKSDYSSSRCNINFNNNGKNNGSSNNNNITKNSKNKGCNKNIAKTKKPNKSNAVTTVLSNSVSTKKSIGITSETKKKVTSKSTSKNSGSVSTNLSSATTATSTNHSQKRNKSDKNENDSDTKEIQISCSNYEWIWGNGSSTSSLVECGIDNDNKKSELKSQDVSEESNNVNLLLPKENSVKNSTPNVLNNNQSSNSIVNVLPEKELIIGDNCISSINDCTPESKTTNQCGTISDAVNDGAVNDGAVISCGLRKDNDQDIPSFKNSVIKKVINDKTVHLIIEPLSDERKLVVATDELVKNFTNFSSRYSALKVLSGQQIEKPFYDLYKKDCPDLFKEIESFSIEVIQKKGQSLPDKLSVLPLTSAPNILTMLKVDQAIVNDFRVIVDEIKNVTML